MWQLLEILEVSFQRAIHVFFSNLKVLSLSSSIQSLSYPTLSHLYMGIIASCSRKLRRSELKIIKNVELILIVQLLDSQKLSLRIHLFQTFEGVVVSRSRSLLFFYPFDYLVYVCLLVCIANLQFGSLRPNRSDWIMSWPRDRFMYLLFVFNKAPFFCFVSSILGRLPTFEKLSLLDLFGGVKVVGMDTIPFDSKFIQFVGCRIQFLNTHCVTFLHKQNEQLTSYQTIISEQYFFKFINHNFSIHKRFYNVSAERKFYLIMIYNFYMKNEQNYCRFLCCKKQYCDRESQDENEKKMHKFPSFEKLSLKKMKNDTHQMHRTQSFKKIDRPIPTTERSGKEDAQSYFQHLIESKRNIERQLNILNHDFEKYYEIYSHKLKQLKQLNHRLLLDSRNLSIH